MGIKLKAFVTALSVFFALGFAPSRASAGVLDVLDLKVEAAVGGPIALIGANYPGGVTTAPLTLKLAGRIGLPRHSPISLELNAIVPHGIGFNFRLEVLKLANRVSIHLFDLGIFFNLGDPVTVSRIKRTWDLTAGLGCDVRVWRNLEVGLEWRWFLPNPIAVIQDYGSFAYPAYREAARGGQLWATVGYTW